MAGQVSFVRRSTAEHICQVLTGTYESSVTSAFEHDKKHESANAGHESWNVTSMYAHKCSVNAY